MEGSASAAYRSALDRFNAGDLDGYLAFYTDDVVFGGVGPEPFDKAGTRAFHEMFMDAFPGARVEVLDMFEAGDRIAARLAIQGRHEGDFMGVPPTGRDAVLAITTVLTVRDGRCVERWSTADMYGLMVQLSALPAA